MMDSLEETAAKLGEHYDSVLIICTRHEPTEGGTTIYAKGAGNYYARFGSAEEWLLQEREKTRAMFYPKPDA